LNDCSTSGIVVARRPPKMIAEIGTPFGSSANFDRLGLLRIGAVKREFGCAAFSGEAGVHGRPFQSVSSGGGRPVHALPPHVAVGGQRDVGEDRVAGDVAIAFGFDFMLVPGATPK
jgi:hypothetical protein